MKSKWSIILFLLVLAKASFACAPNVACIQWKASSGWSDNKPFAAGTVITYTVWLIKPTGVVDRALVTTAGFEVTISGLPMGKHCFAVTTTARPVPGPTYLDTSALSDVACKTLSFPGPTDGSIVGPTDGSIEQPKKP